MNKTKQLRLNHSAPWLGLCLLAMLCFKPGLLNAAEVSPNAGATNSTETSTEAMHLGVASCANSVCHGRAAAVEHGNVLQNEYRTWAKYDSHSRAYAILKNADSKRIAANMGIKDASTAAECLACHADTTPANLQGPKFHISDGIGCEVCHGGAENWIDSHYGANTSSAADNAIARHQANLKNGLSPTEDPAFAAKLCQSCHLGNTNQLATHEMMAAGHPRLRFELDTWLALMPPHHSDDADYHRRGKSSLATTRWLEGRMQAAQDSLTVLEQHSMPQGLFPELAVFDCHSCHRPMDTSVKRPLADRQLLPAGAIRINDNALRTIATLVSLRNETLGQELTLAIRQLNQSTVLSKQALQASSRKLMTLVEKARQSIDDSALNDSEQQAITIALLKQGASGEVRDYADAEQLFLGLQVLSFDTKNPKSGAKRYDEIFTVLSDENNYTPRRFKAAVQKTLKAATEN
ncbi:multiheme c-type cytochrome [Zhongshania arctica]|uniref:Multiheme c-type cytochrome n=1 Tax=Zhongshania arctica TaxID=3238302 RepID=A0ABV3TSD9_9GAMM